MHHNYFHYRRIFIKKASRFLAVCAAINLFYLPAAFTPSFAAEPLVGSVYVLDGDTLSLRTARGRNRIRLQGIDACEREQNAYRKNERWPCGQKSKDWMIDFTHGKTVTCKPEGRDRYHRLLAVCFIDNEDIGAASIAAGMAIHAYTDNPEYAALERQAQIHQRGIWAYEFDKPSIWRRNNPASMQ